MLNGNNHNPVRRRQLATTSSTLGDDVWYVPKKEHYLTSVRIFKNKERVSGLEVRFEANGVPGMTGYEPLTHLFGRSTLTSEYHEFSITD